MEYLEQQALSMFIYFICLTFEVQMVYTLSHAEILERHPDTLENLRRASQEWGFFYLKDIPLTTDLMSRVLEMSDRFFELPIRDKQKISLNGRRDFRGYLGPGEEFTYGRVDLKESLEFAQDVQLPTEVKHQPFARLYSQNVWPEESLVPGFQDVLQDYLSRVEKLGKQLAEAYIYLLSSDLAQYNSFWHESLHFRSRLVNYDALPDIDEGNIRMDAHVDFGMFNLLYINGPGLEVEHVDGHWAKVPPQDSTLVVLLGELCQWWTRGLSRPANHRVRHIKMDKQRTSIPCFFYPNLQTAFQQVAPLADETLLPPLAGQQCGTILVQRLLEATGKLEATRRY